jgi:hypothetical protein
MGRVRHFAALEISRGGLPITGCIAVRLALVVEYSVLAGGNAGEFVEGQI